VGRHAPGSVWPLMAEDEAPPVVAVVVASDPGPWFEECLAALGGQDYPNLSVLVVDSGCTDDPAPRVAAVLPKAYLRRVGSNLGFGPSANEVLGAVTGASHLLLCHDDVAPATDAVRRMVEEAFRSNAGIVTPKYVAWNDPDRLLQVGLGADRFGSPVPRVEASEIDQEQHDEVREVFAAPGGCTLVRADLFETLGGFDPEIFLLGEDIDLSWRAQNAGARVVVAPSAAVRHLEATAGGVRERPDRHALQRRHELRAVLKNYGLVYRSAVLAEMAVLALLEILYCLVIDDRGRAREVVAAWRWNLAPGRGLRRARKQVRACRRLPDHVVSRLRAPARRPRNFLLRRSQEETTAAAGRFPAHGTRARISRAAARPSRRQAEAIVASAALVLVVLFGLRGLVTGALPVVGGYAPLPHATSLLSDFFGGWTAQGAQLRSPSTPAFGMLGLAGLVVGGAMGFLFKVVLFGSLAAGAIGAARLMSPFGSTRAKVVAAVAYLVLPLAWDDVAKGDLPALVVFAATPFVLSRLVRAMGAAGPAPLQALPPAGWVREVTSLGLVVAVAGSFAPAIVLTTLAIALAMGVGSLLTGDGRAAARMVTVALGGCVLAVVLTLPWSISFFGPGRTLGALVGALGGPAVAPSLGDLMRFDVGPIGRGLFGWGVLAAGTLPLMIGRGVRLRTATRWWAVVLGSFALAWAGVEGWLGAGGSASGVFLAPAAAALAGCVALGVVAFEQDLASYSFGWRQAVTGAAAVCAVAGALPFLAATTGGRFSVPGTGYEQVLGYLDAARPPAVPYRVLWLGDPGALPLRGWQVAPGYSVAMSENGLPDATGSWPAASPGAASRVTADVELARHGLTVDLGSLLAAFGVRYVVVPGASAPVLTGIQTATSLPPPPGLLTGLALQGDLRELAAQAGSTVFVNAAWSPGDGREPLPGASRPPLGGLGGGAAAIEIVLFLAAAIVTVRRPRRARREEPLAGGADVVAEPSRADEGPAELSAPAEIVEAPPPAPAAAPATEPEAEPPARARRPPVRPGEVPAESEASASPAKPRARRAPAKAPEEGAVAEVAPARARRAASASGGDPVAPKPRRTTTKAVTVDAPVTGPVPAAKPAPDVAAATAAEPAGTGISEPARGPAPAVRKEPKQRLPFDEPSSAAAPRPTERRAKKPARPATAPLQDELAAPAVPEPAKPKRAAKKAAVETASIEQTEA
jgi:GT2 family glycosyltransferase